MLAGHEEGDHHVCDFFVRDCVAVTVHAVHEVPDHVFGVGSVWVGGAASSNDL